MKKIFILTYFVLHVFLLQFADAQWLRVKSLTGGHVACISKDGNTIYSLIANFGLVKSVDGGNNWNIVTDSLNGDVFDGRVIAEGNKIFIHNAVGTNFFWYSVDSGMTWQHFTLNGTFSSVEDICLYKGKLIGIDFSGYIYISDDNGTSWHTDSIVYGYYSKIEIADGKIFLVSLSGNGSLKTSYDTCQTWIDLGPEATSYDYSFAAKGDTLALLSPFSHVISISTDFGTSWNIIPSPFLRYYTCPVIYFDNEILYLVNNDSIYKTYDLGQSWNFLAYHPGLRATSIVKTGNNLLIASRNLGFIKFNLSNYSIVKKSKDILAMQVHGIQQKGDTVLVIGRTLIFYSHDGGDTWGYSIPPVDFFINPDVDYSSLVLAFDTGAVYLNCGNDIIYRSTDWGPTWMAYDTLYTGKIVCYNGKIYYADNKNVLRGNNSGGTATNYGTLNSHINDLIIFDNKLYAITEDNIFYTDLTPSPQWKITNFGITNPTEFWYGALSDTAIFIGGPYKCVYRCYKNDTVWQNLGLCHKYLSDLKCHNNDVFSTSYAKRITILQNFNGSNWTSFNDGLQGYRPVKLSIGDSAMYCGGSRYQTGFYRRSVTDIPVPVGFEENDESNNNFYFSAFPNPTNDFITVHYNITSSKETTLSLFNIYGQKLKTIYNAKQPAGEHELKMDLKDVDTGIYFVKLSAEGKEGVRKVVKAP